MESRSCNYCQKPAELICQRCRDPYCSRNCQNLDWPQHKLFCFPMPLLVKAMKETSVVKSETKTETDLNSSLNSSAKLRNITLSTEYDASLTNGISKISLFGNKENDSVKINKIPSGNVSSVDRSSLNDKWEAKTSVKPPYRKMDKIDVASLRKPGTLSQVLPKQNTVERPKPDKIEPLKSDKIEPPKQDKIELPKQDEIEPLKPDKIEPPKQDKIELPKQDEIEPPKQPKVEPLKQAVVEMPKQITVEPSKQATVESPKQIATNEALRAPQKLELSAPSVTIPCSKECESTAAESKPSVEPEPQSTERGAWMKPFPIEENEFVDVIVQYVCPDSTTWVSLLKNDEANNDLLRQINKKVSTLSKPNSNEIKVNSLFIVPFEEIYYRGIILQPVSATGTVSVRLVDFGNDFDLPIDELKSPLPAMAEKNAFAFPIKFKNPRNAEISNCIKIKKVSMDHDVVTVIVEGETSILTMKDIDLVPIPVGANRNLVCLDFSNVSLGYISACVADVEAVKFVEKMGPIISKSCKQMNDTYCPEANELCLVRFDDGEWYRAVTLKVIDANKFEIMFIDYGNKMTVDSAVIRKMMDDFLHPCLMNTCHIKGFPKTPTKDDIQKTAVYFNEHPTFQAETVEKKGDEFVIHVVI